MGALSHLEHALTLPLRRFLQARFTAPQIRYAAFALSLTTCLLDASVVTFSLFTAKFIAKLHYSQVDINVISGVMLSGLYLTLPLLGYLADAHGPVLLAVIGLAISPGYLLALWVYKSGANYWWMAVAFFLVGLGTSSSYFCSLLTCAKVFPERNGLQISLPVTCYGLSSLLLAWVFTWDAFADGEGGVSIEKVFGTLTLLYAAVGAINWTSSVVVSIEKEAVFAQLLEEERAQYGSLGDEGADPSLDAPLVGQAAHEAKFAAFLRDPSMHLLFLALFLLAGPLELYVANLGSIERVLSAGSSIDVGYQVGIFSLFSTLTRLSMGVLSDKVGSLRGNTNLLLGFGVGLALAGFALVSQGTSPMAIVSAMVGVSYGAVFTLFPTLCAMVWGVDILGSTWGLFLAAPALGALVFGLVYAVQYDAHCPHTGCLQWPFATFCVLFLMSGALLKAGLGKLQCVKH